ncbi:hypothetical protein RvY_05963-2 [Ramazzottius varieornatus]|uniref:Carbohydrate kinase FGGY C-terminal domain-containing protein n=1 Tax=Ramazzottius varieornatus TaxID=947166 RepID=A0A1D1V0E8_RAMVA|nr:hypothetical protein RvY_05963-2 [Ramazzottius varieornatus]
MELPEELVVGDICWATKALHIVGISHSAIKTLFDHEDRLQTCPYDLKSFRGEMLRYFNVTKKSEMLQFYYSTFDKAFVAKFCPDIVRLALNGDAFSNSVFRTAGAYLAKHVRAVLPDVAPEVKDQAGGVPVICVGSVFNSWNLLKDGFVAELGDNIPELSLFKLCGSSAVGAAFLGAKKAGVDLPINHLRPAELFFTLGSNSKKLQNGQ